MPVIIVGNNGGGSADGHTHANMSSLNKLQAPSPGVLLVDGKAVQEAAIELSYEHILTALDLTQKYVELPHDCDEARAITVQLESVPQSYGKSWVLDERDWPVKDRLSWAALPGSNIAKLARNGDRLTVTYYKKQ